MIQIVSRRLLVSGFRGMAIYPFLIMKDESLKNNIQFINHETIHFHQQRELLLILFYIIYSLEYVFRVFQYRNFKKAYFNISFEREAYANQNNPEYLKDRKFWAFTKYF
jgi:hypothetical protein